VSRPFPVAMARGKHLFPFRTEPLSPSAPMVLGPQGPGRVGRRRFFCRASGPPFAGRTRLCGGPRGLARDDATVTREARRAPAQRRRARLRSGGHDARPARPRSDVRGPTMWMRRLAPPRLGAGERGVDELREAGPERGARRREPEHVFAG